MTMSQEPLSIVPTVGQDCRSTILIIVHASVQEIPGKTFFFCHYAVAPSWHGAVYGGVASATRRPKDFHCRPVQNSQQPKALFVVLLCFIVSGRAGIRDEAADGVVSCFGDG